MPERAPCSRAPTSATSAKLDEYRAIGGYAGVEKARERADDLIAELQANLRGRGGAGFPMGRKASLIDRKSGRRHRRQRRRVGVRARSRTAR